MLRHNYENKKKKIKHKITIESNQDKQSILGNKDVSQQTIINGNNVSAQSLRKGLEQVSAALEQEKQARAQLQQKVLRLYKRNMDKENEFRRIIQATIPYCKGQQKTSIQISSLHTIQQAILRIFEQNNLKVEEKLQKDGQSLQGVMQRKIKNITDHMQSELEKAQKKMKLNYETIYKQIKNMIKLSSDILDQNDIFRKKINDLLLKNEILKSQKELLIAEALEKKDLILKMHKKLKNKYERDSIIESELNLLKKQRRQVEQQYVKYERQIRSKIDNHEANRAKSIQVFQIDDFGFKIDRPRKIGSAKKNFDTSQSRQSTIGTRPIKSKQQARRVMTTQGKRQYDSKNSFQPNRTQTIASQLFDIRPVAEPSLTEMRHIIRTEKKKNSQLTKKLNQYQVLQQEMNSLLQDLLEVNREQVVRKKCDDQSTLKLIKNSGKIYQMVKQLERRLLSSANPVINSGYNDLDNLLNECKQSSS